MSMTVLEPHAIADRCYLNEALLWVAFQRFPLSNTTEDNLDNRIDPNCIDGLEPYLSQFDMISPEQCLSAGLPTNPHWEALETGEIHIYPEDIRKLLDIEGLSEEQHEELNGKLEKSMRYFDLENSWNAELSVFLDVYKARLFLSLREGKIRSYGQKLPRGTIPDSLEFFSNHDWEGWLESDWMAIPSDFWISHKVDWNACHAEGRDSSYALILLDCTDLLLLFPYPRSAHIEGVMKVGDMFVMDSNGQSSPTTLQRRGRPPFNWTEFHVEVARRISKSGLQPKQEAMVADLQEWCKKKWGRDVGRSTILDKLKPYYDAFKLVP